jgi:adenylosuccinate synthase
MDPIGILNELDLLKEQGISPVLFIDMKCPVTTPFEKQYNNNHEAKHNHGTCGVGVGQTYQREEDHFHLIARDLLYKNVLLNKLDLLYGYYTKEHYPDQYDIDHFIYACNELISSNNIHFINNIYQIIGDYDDIIFEGSQGLLLDEDIGFFPHVTRGHTSSKNIIKIINEAYESYNAPKIYLVTRAYQTRHGNGPMTNEGMEIPDNLHEHNTNVGKQGVFRKTVLDLDLLDYAIQSDPYIRKCENKTLVITCMDVPQEYIFTHSGRCITFGNAKDFVKDIAARLGIDRVMTSYSPVAGDLWHHRYC